MRGRAAKKLTLDRPAPREARCIQRGPRVVVGGWALGGADPSAFSGKSSRIAAMIELKNAKLFEGLPAKELKALGNEFKTVAKPAGSQLVVTGDSGVGFMIILDGTVEVTTMDGRKRTLGPGDSYGEMALLNEGARSATIVAKSDVQLAGLVSRASSHSC